MKRIVRQLRHGQITIPKELREAAGIEPGDLLTIDIVKGKLEVEPVKVAPKAKGSPWARELYALFAPTRRGLKGRSEMEVNTAIDEAVKKVRASTK